MRCVFILEAHHLAPLSQKPRLAFCMKICNATDVQRFSQHPTQMQLTAVAAVAAVAVAAGRMLRSPRLAPLRVAVWGAGALFLGWRFTSASFSRLVGTAVSSACTVQQPNGRRDARALLLGWRSQVPASAA